MLKKVLVIFLITASAGCKITYDDIHFENFNSSNSELKGFAPENHGYLIYDIEAGKIVKGHNINREFTPASVTKLFTALFAVEVLGAEYTFPTTVSFNGKISDGVLSGDLYIKGSGDPELALSGLLKLVNGLKMKKIKEVKGNFYYDESSFTAREVLDRTMPAEAYYNAGVSPLTFNSSIIFALQRRSKEGRITSADFLPPLASFSSYIYSDSLPYPFLKFSLADNKETWGFPDKNLWENRQQLPVKRPGLYTAMTFRELCNIHGIKLPYPVNGITGSATIIQEYNSPSLAEITKNMLYTSNNMTAELICTASSEVYAGKNGNTGTIENFYKTGFTGLNWKNFRIANASGLTNLNRATPEQTCAVLLYIEKSKKENFTLEEILPLSGWDGTMKGRLDQPETAFRIYGKTGSIFYSSGLAGILYASSGRRYIYSVYINDNIKRQNYDLKKEKTAEDLNTAGAWTKKAAASIDEFMLKMIKEL